LSLAAHQEIPNGS